MFQTINPKPDSIAVEKLRKRLGVKDNAHSVRYEATSGMRPLYCFDNVPAVVAIHGGRKVFGWVVWQYGAIYVEAEHHCVWEKPDGEWICVTPQDPLEEAITFIPDESAVYDYSKRLLTDNVRVPLLSHQVLQQYLDFSALLTLERNTWSRERWPEMIPTLEQATRLAELTRLKNELFSAVLYQVYRDAGRNDPCPCGSGTKFKKCHEQSIGL